MKRESYKSANAAIRKMLDDARAKLTKQSKPSMVRQLVRVDRAKGKTLAIVVPGWCQSESFEVERALLPTSWGSLRSGYRFFARVDLSAAFAEDLNLSAPFEEGGYPTGERRRLTEKRIELENIRMPKRPKKPPTPTQKLVKVLVKALTEYHAENRLHHDGDARLYALSKRALKKAERWIEETR